ncbi:MAG: PHP domain-containing protein [Chloroflexota bacterium]|nr:PHP domain-containing protein [Chloroflexota bacterium]
MAITTKLPKRIGVDLHIHTQASDGQWTPESLIETAVERGVQIISVTDHDTVKNVKAVESKAKAAGLDFITGVEVTVDWKGAVYHLLLFGLDPDNTELLAMLEDTQRRQWNKRQRMIDGLKSKGYNLNALAAVDYPGGGHSPVFELSRALLHGGEVESFSQARALCREVDVDGPITQSVKLALAVGLAAGAIPVLAHPGRGGSEISAAPNEVLEEMVQMGLKGVEVYHYTHTPEMVERLMKFARKHDLLISCGSDSHDEVRGPKAWHPELCRSLLEHLGLEDSYNTLPLAA